MGVAEETGLRGRAPRPAQGTVWGPGLDESLVEQQAPAGMGLGALAAGAGQVLLGQVAGIHQRDHLKMGAPGLERHQKKHPLGVQGGIQIPTFPCQGHPIEQPEQRMVEVTLCAHVVCRVRHNLEGTVPPAQPDQQQQCGAASQLQQAPSRLGLTQLRR